MADLKKKVKLHELPDLLTVREVAELLRVSPLTIKRWGKRGKLPAATAATRKKQYYGFWEYRRNLSNLLAPLNRSTERERIVPKSEVVR